MQKNLIFPALIALLAFNTIAYGKETDTVDVVETAASAPDGKATPDTIRKNERLSYHFQATMAGMIHSDFSAPYTGANSLLTSEPAY